MANVRDWTFIIMQRASRLQREGLQISNQLPGSWSRRLKLMSVSTLAFRDDAGVEPTA
jgi:hypothetical protein